MKVKWTLELHHIYNADLTGEVEVDDTATAEDIEAEVKEDMWNWLSLSWECEEMELTEQDVADQMSNALNAVGEASIAIMLAEREACAKEIEAMIRPGINLEATIALTAAAKRIRNRPK